MVLNMVWFFVLLTVVTYLFLMKYVLNNVQPNVKAANNQAVTTEKNQKKLIPAHTAR